MLGLLYSPDHAGATPISQTVLGLLSMAPIMPVLLLLSQIMLELLSMAPIMPVLLLLSTMLHKVKKRLILGKPLNFGKTAQFWENRSILGKPLNFGKTIALPAEA
jgi:hypothetical protein